MQGIVKKNNGELWLEEFESNGFKASYKINDIIYSEKSKFQEISIVDSEMFGKILVLDGIVQTTALDGHIYNEMISHIPILTHSNPKNILVIGGGDCGVVSELAKYDFVENIDLVEIDELVVSSCKEHLQEISNNISDQRINYLFEDGAKYVKEKQNHYDLVIVDSSDPIGPAEILFRYDFYKDIYNSLKYDGVMVCQSQSPIFHMDVLTQSYNNIKELFNESKLYTAVVPTYPGGLWSFTLGSKQDINIDTSKLSPNTRYINKDILHSCFKLPKFINLD